MRIRLALLVVMVCSFHLFGYESPKPFATVDLSDALLGQSGCVAKGIRGVDQLFWVDDAHLAFRAERFCQHPAQAASPRREAEIFIIYVSEHVVSLRTGPDVAIIRGHTGTVLIGREHEVEVLDTNLVKLQSFSCEQAACRFFVPPPSTSQTDFSICSIEVRTEKCTFYQGSPAMPTGTIQPLISLPNGVPKDPYKQPTLPEGVDAHALNKAIAVNEKEIWFFGWNGLLMAALPNGKVEPVPTGRWTPNRNYCRGEISIAEPRRFLAICNGVNVYTDGEFDAIFGFSRVVVFDVASRRIIGSIAGRGQTTASLSPSGQLVAVAHNGKVQMYRIH